MNTSRFKGIMLAALLLLGTAQTSHAILAAVSPQVDGVNGYPLWYQDTNGLAVQLCLDPANCLFDPPDPLNAFSVAIGFGAEAFYWSADATIALPGGGSALLVLALEAAWLNEEPVAGEQIVFARTRVRIDAPAGTPAGNWTIQTPFQTLVLPGTADGAGNEVNFTDDVGCFAQPCDFSLALQGSVGPFLSAVAPAPPAGFLGDGATPSTIEPGPNGALFSVQGPGGVSGSTNLFVVQGRISPLVVAIPLTVERATYARTGTGGAVDVIAHSTSGATVSFTGGPNLPAGPQVMTGDGVGSFFSHLVLANASVLPTHVTVNATDPVSGLADSAVLRPLVDVVIISEASFNLSSGILSVKADSSDKGAVLPTLTVAGFGPMTGGSLVVGPFVVPPGTVTVNSSAGGSDNRAVQIITETLNITFARLGRVRPNLTVRGTSTVAGPGNIITIHLGGAAGPVIGTAAVDAAGNFAFFRARVPAGLRPARAGGQITAVSSSGAEATAILPFP